MFDKAKTVRLLKETRAMIDDPDDWFGADRSAHDRSLDPIDTRGTGRGRNCAQTALYACVGRQETWEDRENIMRILGCAATELYGDFIIKAGMHNGGGWTNQYPNQPLAKNFLASRIIAVNNYIGHAEVLACIDLAIEAVKDDGDPEDQVVSIPVQAKELVQV